MYETTAITTARFTKTPIMAPLLGRVLVTSESKNSLQRIQKLKETRIGANLQATLSLNPHTCVHCGLVCKYLAGLKMSSPSEQVLVETTVKKDNCQNLMRRNRRESPFLL